MSRYRVNITWTEHGHIDVEADNEEDAIEQAAEAIDFGDVEVSDDGDYEYEIEELD